MGDLLLPESFPSVRVEVDRYLKILDKIQAIFPAGTKLVGGHGKLVDISEIQTYKDMLTDVLSFVRTGIKNNITKDDMIKSPYLKKYESYNTFIPQLRVDYWIDAIYRKEQQ